MKNKTFAVYAVPVALLMMAGGLAAPSASADGKNSRQTVTQTVTGVFTYDRHAPAEQIYAKLLRTAKRLCASPGSLQIYSRKQDQACIASVIESGVSRLARADIAQIHDRHRG